MTKSHKAETKQQGGESLPHIKTGGKTMLRDCANNRNALQVQRILTGEMKISTYNLRICFFDFSMREHNSIEACMKEIEEKMSPEEKEEPFMKECIEEFNEKLDIYDRFFRELSRREIEEGLR